MLSTLAASVLYNPSYHSVQSTGSTPGDEKPLPPTKYALGRGDQFPTERRPKPRPLSDDPTNVINTWFKASQITIGTKADSPHRIIQAKRLLYTWRDCFAESVRDIAATDLIEHSIDMTPDAQPVRRKACKYTPKERSFANEIFPAMEDAGIIVRRSSPWGAQTKFPPKKPGSEELRVVHNFRPANKYTIKSGYPVHRLEEVLEVLIKPGFGVYFSTDAANGYWAIPMKTEHINRTGFITPNGQWVYLRMGQGLKGAAHTYSQFTDLVFGPLPKSKEGIGRMPTVIGTGKDSAFGVYMDDHASSARSFDAMFKFLHEIYFPRAAFGPVYLSGRKTSVFTDHLDLLGFRGTEQGIRPSSKHRNKVTNWPVPRNREELDAFLWLTPFLRIFIPGRAAHVMKLKEAYLRLVPATVKKKKTHDDDVEVCDENLTKTKIVRPRKPTIQRVYEAKDTFDWGAEQQISFDTIKQAISSNAMSGTDPTLQYHLVVDASKTAIGGVLFQMKDVPAGTEASPKFLENERINMFLSFRLADAETRYSNSERECLAVVRCLAEIKWLIIGSKYSTMVYSDHSALQAMFEKGESEKARINGWLDCLGEFDLHLVHRPSKDQHIGLADGLSRMPTRLTFMTDIDDKERLAFAAVKMQTHTTPIKILAQQHDRLQRYRDSPLYAHLVEYLQTGPPAIEELDRNIKRHIIRKAKRYRITGGRDDAVLRYHENNGSMSLCLIEEEISRFLNAAHEDHGHFGAALAMDYLVGRAYWPTRVTDVHEWCQSCHACQMKAHKPIKTRVQGIQVFEPMKMLGMDWLGPITPACSLTGHKYVLLMVDYFSRFAWAKSYTEHTNVEVRDMFENHISPIFGHPKGVYSDNGSHFVNEHVKVYFQNRGIIHHTGPISHPSSTGLLERTVQGMLSFLRAKCIERASVESWSLHVREGVFSLNTKHLRVHGFSPAELILGFQPELLHFDTQPAEHFDGEEVEIEDVPEHQHRIYMALRDENKRLASEAAAYTHYQKSKRDRRQRIPEPGDLVIVRNHAVDAQKGRKLEAKWLGPRIFTGYTATGLSGHVREVHGEGVTKKYHLNDILLYKDRRPFHLDDVEVAQGPHGTNPAVIGGRGTGEPGSRAVFLRAR